MYYKIIYKKTLLLLLCIILCLISGCSKTKTELPADLTEVEGLFVSDSYAVITEPYTAFKLEPSIESETTGHARGGDIYIVQAVSYISNSSKRTKWYYFEQGWLPESVLTIYKNHLQANTASKAITAEK